MCYVIGLFLIIAVLIVFILLSIPFRKYLPKWYTCELMYWHGDVDVVGYNGCSVVGKCLKCDKKVMQDSQGNWFNTYEKDEK